MYCIDEEFEDLVIYGIWRNSEYQSFDVVLVPCNYLHTDVGYNDDSIHPECIADLKQ